MFNLSHRKGYLDGYVMVCTPKQTDNGFGAVNNPRSKADLNMYLKLAYNEMFCREGDYQYASRHGRTLSYKIRVPYCRKVNTSHYIVVGDMLYSIIDVDNDINRQNTYITLEEVRKLDN